MKERDVGLWQHHQGDYGAQQRAKTHCGRVLEKSSAKKIVSPQCVHTKGASKQKWKPFFFISQLARSNEEVQRRKWAWSSQSQLRKTSGFVWKTQQDRTMQPINQEFGFQMSTSPAPGFGKDNREGQVRGYRQDTVPVEEALGNRSKTSVRPWCFHVTALWPGVLQLSFLSHPRSFHGDTSSQSCEWGESRRGPKRPAERPSNQLQRQIII